SGGFVFLRACFATWANCSSPVSSVRYSLKWLPRFSSFGRIFSMRAFILGSKPSISNTLKSFSVKWYSGIMRLLSQHYLYDRIIDNGNQTLEVDMYGNLRVWKRTDQ